MYFLGVRGLTTLSYTAYSYSISGHTDLYMYMFLYSRHTLLYNIFISLEIKILETYIHSFWYGSFQTGLW